jgi:rhodanese-related sulfurtransferase
MEYVIDVRTPEEFAEGHYTDAVNHELLLLEDELMPEYPKDAAIYVYCKRGIRAEKAKKILHENGFTNVTNIGGYDPALDVEESI